MDSDTINSVRSLVIMVVGYLFSAIVLFWPGWKLTRKIKKPGLRVLVGATVIALAFAPGVLSNVPDRQWLTPFPSLLVIPISLLRGASWSYWLYSIIDWGYCIPMGLTWLIVGLPVMIIVEEKRAEPSTK